MRLRDLPTRLVLQTSTDDLIRVFYEPALAAAATYDRGVGYFTSQWLKMVSKGLAAFAAGGGRARLIVSPHLSPEDWEAIRLGEGAKTDVLLRAALDRELQALINAGANEHVAALGRMVADRILEFKIALPTRDSADFHDKFGVLRDREGDCIAFHGSQNDSGKAFQNFEAISLFYSWLKGSDAERIEAHAQRFERLWRNEMPNVRVLDLPEAVAEGLAALGKAAAPSEDAPAPPPPSSPGSNTWRHQDEAVEAFLRKRAGILEMATGTGKTRTALRILRHLKASGEIDAVVVTMSGTDLLDQWYGELVKLDAFVVHRVYGGHNEGLAFLNDPAGAILLASRQALPRLLGRVSAGTAAKSLLICDEVHGLGSPALVTSLQGQLDKFRFRLGLSATPNREYDEVGVDFITRELGPVIFQFGLEEAIKRGILCEFDYHPLDYDFSDEDKVAVRRAISRYHAHVRAGHDPGRETMYRDIAQVGKATRSKLPAFTRFLGENPGLLARAILFVDNASYGMAVQDIILPVAPRYHTYYAEDDRANLVHFAGGGLDTLITCHRISEGIDIQSVNTVILFASARSRLETVQRLGRCLRRDPNNPGKRAQVIDFIRTDDIDAAEADAPPTGDQSRRDWLTRLSKTRAN